MSFFAKRFGWIRLAPHRVAVTLLACLCSSAPLFAPPVGEEVVAGSADFNRDGALTTITASDGAVINYTGFDIGTLETVVFVQPTDVSRVLNRVYAEDPTNILGTLRANGIVYLVNPAGLYFGQSAFLDVGGLFAAAGNISNQDFLAGSNHFSGLEGALSNAGTIEAASGVSLLGRTVANHGSILSRGGEVALLAGNEVYVGEAGQRVFVNLGQASTTGTGVENTGRIEAGGPGGSVTLAVGDIYSLAIQQNGQLFGSRVTVDAGAGRAEVGGTIDASNTTGAGGSVAVLGNQVHVKGTAAIDASGATDGGTVLIGGDFQGNNPDIRNATRTAVAEGATIRADAGGSSNGGRVIVWADDATSFWGSISARGGAAGGNGGFAEVSGKENLSFAGSVDLGAAHGANGTLLLDPGVLSVDSEGGDDNELADGSILFADGGSAEFSVSAGAVEAALDTQDVTLQATQALNVFSSIDARDSTAVTSLTLAAPAISLIAGITTRGGQTYQGTVVVDSTNNESAIVLQSLDGGNITFGPLTDLGPTPIESRVDGVIDGSSDLAIFTTGTTVVTGEVGGITPLDTFFVNIDTSEAGPTRIEGGLVSTFDTQFYGGPVAFTRDTTLTGFDVEFAGGASSVTGPGTTLTLQPAGSGDSIDIGTTGSEGFDLTTADIDAIASGFTAIVIGREDGAAGINVSGAGPVGSVTFNQPGSQAPLRVDDSPNIFRSRPVFRMPFGGITVGQDGGVGSAAGMEFTAESINVLADLASAGGSIVMTGSISVDGSRTLDTTDDGAAPAGADILLAGPVGEFNFANLSVNAGTGGTATFNEEVSLFSLEVTGRAALLGTRVATTGDQTYFGNVVLGPSITIGNFGSGSTGLSFRGSVTSAGATPSNVTFDAQSVSVVGDLGGQGAAALGNVVFLETFTGGTIDISNVTAGSLTANGPITLNGTRMETSGAQSFSNNVTQNANLTVVASDLALPVSESTWDAGGSDLTLTIGNGITLPGSFVNLGDFASTGAGATSLAGTFTTAGSQSYANGDVILTDSTTLVSSGNAALTLGSDVTGESADLTLNTTGLTVLGGAIGVASLTTNEGGSTLLNSSVITTSGGQTYGDAVDLGGLATLTSTSGGGLTFNAAVNGSQSLELRTTGATTFAGSVGETTPLTSILTDAQGTTFVGGALVRTNGAQTFNDALSLGGSTVTLASLGNGDIAFVGGIDGSTSAVTVNTGGLTRLSGSSSLASLDTDAAGSTVLEAEAVSTAGAQIYRDSVSVDTSATVALTGSTIELQSTVGSAVDGVGGLSFSASAGTILGGAIGGAGNRLGSLSASGGPISINGGRVATTGLQQYDSAVTQGAGTVVEAGSLVVNSQSWNAANTDLTLTVQDGVTVSSVFQNIDSFRSDGAGATTLVGDLTTLGSQTFANGDLVVSSDATLASMNNAGLNLESAVTGTSGLTLATGGVTTLGGVMSLGSLATTGGGSTVINTTAITTSGAQTYGDAVTLASSSTLESSSGGEVTFNATLDGAQALTVMSSGMKTFAADVGGATALESLTTGGLGTTAINTASIRTSGNQSYGDAVQLGVNTTLNTTDSAVVFGDTLTSGTGGTRDLAVNTGTGAITMTGVAGGLGAVALNSSGVTRLNSSLQATTLTTDSGGSTQLNGDVATTLTQTFNDDVRVDADLSASASNSVINFAGLIDSESGETNNLTVDAGTADVLFDRNIGSAESGALGDFTVTGNNVVLQDVTTVGDQTYNASNLLFLNSTYETNGGSLELNAGASADPDSVAVWKSSSGDLTFDLGGGALTIAPNAGTVVSDGGLVVNEPSAVSLGNVAVAQEFTILAPSGQILLTGTQYFASNISFSGESATVVAPTGETIIFGTVSGVVDANITSANPISFQILDPSVLDPNTSFIQSALLFAGTSLTDALNNPLFLRFPGEERFTTVSKIDTAKFLAGSLPSQEVEVAPETSISEAQRQQMVQLGIYARPITTEEDRKRLFAHGVYRQLIADATASPDQFEVADVRLSAAAVQAALDQFHAIFTVEGTGGASSSRGAELQQLLSDAYFRYVSATPDAEPSGFRAYLQSNRADAGNTRVLELLGQLGELFRRIERLGLTEKELDISKTKVLQEVRVPGLSLRALRTIVDESRPPVASTIAASDPSGRGPRS